MSHAYHPLFVSITTLTLLNHKMQHVEKLSMPISYEIPGCLVFLSENLRQQDSHHGQQQPIHPCDSAKTVILLILQK